MFFKKTILTQFTILLILLLNISALPQDRFLTLPFEQEADVEINQGWYYEDYQDNEGNWHSCEIHSPNGAIDYDAVADGHTETFKILAAADGEVYKNLNESESGGYGNLITIKHTLSNDNIYFTMYAHLREASVLNIGEEVKRGQPIGWAGDTGWSDGVHLHFEVRENSYSNSNSIDPYDKQRRKDGYDCANNGDNNTTEYPDPNTGLAGNMGSNYLWTTDPPSYAHFNPTTYFDLKSGGDGWSPGFDTKVTINAPWTVEVIESSQQGQEPNPGVLSPEFSDLNTEQFNKLEIGVKANVTNPSSPGYIYYLIDGGEWNETNKVTLGSGTNYGDGYKRYTIDFDFDVNIKQFSIELYDVGTVGDTWEFDYVNFYSCYKQWDFSGSPLGWTGRNAIFSPAKSGTFFVGFDTETSGDPTDWSGIISPLFDNISGGSEKYLVFEFSIKNKDIIIDDVKGRFWTNNVWEEGSAINMIKVIGATGINRLSSFYRPLPSSGTLEKLRLDLYRNGDTSDGEDILQITYVDILEIQEGVIVDVIDDDNTDKYIFNPEGKWQLTNPSINDIVYHIPNELFVEHQVHIAAGGNVYSPENLQAINVTVNSVTMTWDSGLNEYAAYNVYKNGILLSSTTNEFYTSENLLSGTTYLFYVTAVLNAEESEPSNIISPTTSTSSSSPILRTPIDPIIYGTVDIGNCLELSTTLYNDGGSTLIISGATKFNDLSDYTITTPFPISIAPNSSATFSVNFCPISFGSRGESLRLIDNDPNTSAGQINLAGQGGYDQPPEFPLTVEAETMEGVGELIDGEGRRLVSGGEMRWFIFQTIPIPESGWIHFDVYAKAECQVNNEWPKLIIKYTDGAQEVNSTNYEIYTFTQYFSNSQDFSMEINIDEQTRQTAGHSIIVDKTILSYFEPLVVLQVSPITLDFGDAESEKTFQISNVGETGWLDWTTSGLYLK
ncbi:peptidoglycan DD-metalloendopeptidase family protein [candidate division KSB1 bacterium]|nr:peptidoglycan DD-metalloendopeptidase family protein [candidate division KSB1 bacterium]